MRSYRWGKFQGWFTLAIGLLTWGSTIFGRLGISWISDFTAGIGLIFLGIGLILKRRFGLVLLYTSLLLIAYAVVFLKMGIAWDVFIVCWYLIPAIFYYPKRWKEFSKGSSVRLASVSAAKTEP